MKDAAKLLFTGTCTDCTVCLGIHDNEQKGRSGGHTSKPYFLGIQQPTCNQVSGVPGDVGVRTDFPSLDELEGKMILDTKHQSNLCDNSSCSLGWVI